MNAEITYERSALPDKLPRDDAGLKALAKQLGCAKKDLFVLAPANDPFNVDTPVKRRDAEWFAELWRAFGYTSGVHSRRVHYHAGVQRAGEFFLPDGTPYENTDECWQVLADAAVYARDLGIIDPALFEDRRNDKTRVVTWPRMEPAEPVSEVTGAYIGWTDPGRYVGDPWVTGLRIHLPDIEFSRGGVTVGGYDYQFADQPYVNEMWVEKSTMDDVLVPLCAEMGVNYTPGKGFTSRTRVVEMLHRARRLGKPLRVFVISDYDPAGASMPRSIARVIEFYRDQIAPQVEVAVHNIGMTRDWAERYELPRAPIKAKDKRKANFEAVHGEGCVELDALEVLHPGALAREIRSAVNAYRDADLPVKLRDAERAASAHADREWHAISEPIRAELGTVTAAIGAVRDRYQSRVDELRAAMDAEVSPLLVRYRNQAEELSAAMESEIEPYRERVEHLGEELRDLADDPDLDLPARPDGDALGGDESGWLYDSRRHWWVQLDHYRRDKNGGAS